MKFKNMFQTSKFEIFSDKIFGSNFYLHPSFFKVIFVILEGHFCHFQ